MADHRPSYKELARRAGLRYVSDDESGIARQGRGRGFSYHYGSGKLVRDRRHLERIESLAIPPAWTDVWICRDFRGHLQATGRDDKGRKQFLYHPQWQTTANRAKFEQLSELGDVLPRIRRRVAVQLRRRKLLREKILALIVRLLDLTGMRVGHEEYVQENGAYGLTTLRRKHLHLDGTSAEFRFPGKARQRQIVNVKEKATLVALESCLDGDCQELFAYQTDGDRLKGVDAEEVNEFLRDISGADITAKDFRTWLASAWAAAELYEWRDEDDAKDRNRILVEVVKEVAERLGNTPAVCRNSYLDPRLLEAYQEGAFPDLFRQFRYRKRKWLRREDQALRHALKHL